MTDLPADESIRDTKLPRLASLLDEIETLIVQYVALPDDRLPMLIACWIANTYAYIHFQYCPYLSIRSVTPQCGKSRLLRLMARLSNGNPTIITTPTAATLYRQHDRRVVILDEVDQLRNADRETRVLCLLSSTLASKEAQLLSEWNETLMELTEWNRILCTAQKRWQGLKPWPIRWPIDHSTS